LELDSLPTDGSPEQIESRESLAMILASGNQARDVVRRMLMVARKAKPELVPTDFHAAVSRSVASCGKSLPPGVRVDVVIDGGAAGLAIINEAELAEMIANLADNAAYAMDGRGPLTIRVSRLEMTEAASTLGVATGSYFRISVADTGHGMDAATRARIFEPFFTTKPIGQGTGLGLSMVDGVLRDWKGAIAVESSIGVGSTFSLYIPVTETS
jgi:signal transduction histidine kinase